MRTPESRARSVSSSARRDLPTPDSPATSASDGLPAAALSSAPESSANSAERPTKRVLVTLVAMLRPSCHAEGGGAASVVLMGGAELDVDEAWVHVTTRVWT